MIIDFHAHIFTDNVAKNALPVLAERAKIDPHTDATAGGLMKSMVNSGIDYTVIANIATRVEQVQKINKWTVELSNTYPQIISLGTLHPGMSFDDMKQEVGYLSKNNIKGIKLHPDYQYFFVDDKRLYLMYQLLSEAGMFILFHSGIDIGLPGEIHCTPQRLLSLKDNNVELKVVAAHMGGYQMWNDVEKYLIGTDIYFDTSFSIEEIGVEKSSELMKKHGVSKILFGTDSPWKSQSEELDLVKSLQLSNAEIQLITSKNAMEILQLK
jgi:predicted TIM-barrel fold metal-dependent hydrolase